MRCPTGWWPSPNVLLIGASGGFRIAEMLALGAAHVTALEPEPVLYRALRHGLGTSPAFRAGSAGENPEREPARGGGSEAEHSM